MPWVSKAPLGCRCQGRATPSHRTRIFVFWVEPLFPILVLPARLRKAGLPHGVQCVPPALLCVSMTVPVLGSLRGRVVARCFRWLAPALGWLLRRTRRHHTILW